MSSDPDEFGPTESGDPLVMYLRSEAWLNPFKKPSRQFVELAVRKATVIIVDDDEMVGAVLRYDARDMIVPIVIMPLVTPHVVSVVADLALDRRVPILPREDLAFTLSRLPYFAPIPGAIFDALGDVLDSLMR